MIIEKRCGRCKEIKQADLFYRSAKSLDGLDCICKTCNDASRDKWRKSNPKQRKLARAQWSAENPDKKQCSGCKQLKQKNDFYRKKLKGLFSSRCKACIKVESHQRYKNNKVEIKTRTAKWSRENAGKKAAFQKAWVEKNTSKYKQSKTKWRLSNPEYHGNWCKKQRRSNINYRLKCNLRARLAPIIRGFKTQSTSAVRDLGCCVQELRLHLQGLFAADMTWENYGNGAGKWNIDHIMPLSAFDLQDRQHFLLANHYLNLQPMWHRDNLAKAASIPTNFVYQEEGS